MGCRHIPHRMMDGHQEFPPHNLKTQTHTREITASFPDSIMINTTNALRTQSNFLPKL